LSALAERYAAALADVAFERRNGDTLRKDLNAFIDLYFQTPDLRNALESPVIESEVKHRVIEQICAKMGLNEAIRNFIYVVVDHGRIHLLHEIIPAFRAELNERLGVADAEVTSAHPLNDADKRQLLAVLEKRTGKKIEARFSEDPALVGGAVVRVGSTIYDGSVREQLNRLREQLETE
jgi:F-type H+-transporting ATPase subunit delta